MNIVFIATFLGMLMWNSCEFVYYSHVDLNWMRVAGVMESKRISSARVGARYEIAVSYSDEGKLHNGLVNGVDYELLANVPENSAIWVSVDPGNPDSIKYRPDLTAENRLWTSLTHLALLLFAIGWRVFAIYSEKRSSSEPPKELYPL